ncbi:MAG: hypothetical protein ABIA66_00805 [Candidatus Omnitrophota bacterium]
MGLSKSLKRIFKKDKGSWLDHKNITQEYGLKLYTAFEPISQVRTFKCNPHARTSIHTVTGHYHLFMYIAALKSLLRFYDDVAIVAHDGDGTLTDSDKSILQHHIGGITIIDRNIADKQMEGILRPFPNCRRYRLRILNSLELLDNGLLATTDRIITMNSDVLFLKKPEELIQWLVSGNNEIIFVHEDTPCTQKEFLEEIGCDFPPHVTLALVCFYKEIIDLELIENVLKKSKFARTHLWTLGQCIYPVLLRNKSEKYKIHSFDKEKWAASGHFREGDIFRHYCSSTTLLAETHFSDFAKISGELAQDTTVD